VNQRAAIPPRDLLRAAITEREERERRVKMATDALARANDLLHDAQVRLTEFAGVDEAIAAYRADRVKAWAGLGGEKPSMGVPENLIARRQARDEAGEEVSAAQSTCKALSTELTSAKAALAEAERGVREAALLVLFEEAERIAARLEVAKREVWRLANQLRGLGRLWAPSGSNNSLRPVQLSPAVLTALVLDEPQHPPLMPPDAEDAARWRLFQDRLLTDPEVMFESGGVALGAVKQKVVA
jgi:hypothetical protein